MGHCDNCGVELEAGRFGRLWYHKCGMTDLCCKHFQMLPSDTQADFVLVDAVEKLGEEQDRYTRRRCTDIFLAPKPRLGFGLLSRTKMWSLLALALALALALVRRTHGHKGAILIKRVSQILLGRYAAISRAGKLV